MHTTRASVIRPADRVRPQGDTPGMEREQALASEGLWMGVVRTRPGVVTGWHHHGEGSAAGSQGVEAILFRVGSGEVVINVDGPEDPSPPRS